MNILVTGAKGFIGKNLCAALKLRDDINLYEYDLDSGDNKLDEYLGNADIIFHLAGINRPKSDDEYTAGNADLTANICDRLRTLGKKTKLVLSSSIQAVSNNPYGRSKKQAEDVVILYGNETGADAVIYRLKNVFGKWCRPNYNSAVATFCYNISHDLPITISNPANIVKLVYIDDVVNAFQNEIDSKPMPGGHIADISESYEISLADLVALITSFKEMRQTLVLPDFSSSFTKKLYATYLSYLEKDDFCYELKINTDNRGSLAEFIKSPNFGQIFVSRTHPGITRGNHWHHTKVEKFMVVEGKGIIRFRHIESDEILEYPVDGEKYQVADIPPGYTHSIENTGDGVMVTLFWASEPFNKENPDTYFLEVKQ